MVGRSVDKHIARLLLCREGWKVEQRPTDNGYRGRHLPLLADDFEQPLQVPIWRSLRKRHARGHYRIAFPRAERDLLKVASNAETVG
jgi:hypothetical protein